MNVGSTRASDRLWQFSERQLRAEFEEARQCVLDRARCSNTNEREVVRRLLWATQRLCADLFAWVAPEFGFPSLWRGPNTITRRLQFVHSFVGYELLDDGDPGALWVRYPTVEEVDQAGRVGRVLSPPLVPAEPHAEGAWEVITPHRDLCKGYYLEAHLTPERVIALLDVHEARNEKNVQDHRDDGETDEDLGSLIQVDEWTAAIREWMAREDILPTGVELDRQADRSRTLTDQDGSEIWRSEVEGLRSLAAGRKEAKKP